MGLTWALEFIEVRSQFIDVVLDVLMRDEEVAGLMRYGIMCNG